MAFLLPADTAIIPGHIHAHFQAEPEITSGADTLHLLLLAACLFSCYSTSESLLFGAKEAKSQSDHLTRVSQFAVSLSLSVCLVLSLCECVGINMHLTLLLGKISVLLMSEE